MAGPYPDLKPYFVTDSGSAGRRAQRISRALGATHGVSGAPCEAGDGVSALAGASLLRCTPHDAQVMQDASAGELLHLPPQPIILTFANTTMQFTIATIVLAAMLPAALAANCQNSGGVANGECVKFYSNDQCKGGAIGSYKPTCEGNCFQGSFSSVEVSGDGTYGTDCTIYSDSNCNNEQTETGNSVAGAGKCGSSPNAGSMKCYYRC